MRPYQKHKPFRVFSRNGLYGIMMFLMSVGCFCFCLEIKYNSCNIDIFSIITQITARWSLLGKLSVGFIGAWLRFLSELEIELHSRVR